MLSKKVLLVDDSEIVLTMASAALESGGYEVRSIERWEDLDTMIMHFIPDLILMDVNMPEVFGDHALMFFKEERGLSRVPILLYSDIDEKELRQRAEACGADGYISKSWGIDRMLEVVNGMLHSA